MTHLENQLVQLERLATYPQLSQLPLEARVLDRLTEVLVLSDELLAEFQVEEANALLWLEPHIQSVFNQIDSLIGRFSQ
ncbi:MAG TPA: hypothetical protein VGQ76_23835 [Thermoanaerobaculia bacterium]|nr:hypothetical protein [Thermoanaerobaculia bacterium]